MNQLLTRLRQLAADEGFIALGIAPAIESTGFSQLTQWIDAGYAGEMQYFADRHQAYRHPAGVLDGVRSIVALAYPYATARHAELAVGQGRIARYAHSGVDYHDVIHPKLKLICQALQAFDPNSKARGVVDTAPLMEREIAQLAGLGWRGKNTLLLNKHLGSYFFLAFVLTDLELPSDAPHESSHCGTCTACLDACPTDAFPTAGVLDATRCISYLTIEHRGEIDPSLRGGIGDWLFGCDICQEVCPWNRKPSRQNEPDPASMDSLDLVKLFAMSDEDFRAMFRKTPLWRTRRRGVLRNAAIVLGNQRCVDAIETLQNAVKNEEPIVADAARWAIQRISVS